MTITEALTKCKSAKLILLNEILLEWNARTKKKPPIIKIMLPDELSEDIQGNSLGKPIKYYPMLIWVEKEEYDKVQNEAHGSE